MRRLIGHIRNRLLRLWRRRRVVHIEGPLEKIDGRWLMRIPLNVGGNVLAATTAGIGRIKDDILEVELPERLVQNLKLQEGQRLLVHNATGKFTFEWSPTEGPAKAAN